MWVRIRPNETILLVLLMFKTFMALNYSVSIQISCVCNLQKISCGYQSVCAMFSKDARLRFMLRLRSMVGT